MRYIHYNPQSIASPLRLSEISIAFTNVDFIGLIGTQLNLLYEKCQTGLTAEHSFIHWSAGKGKYTNKSTGLTLLLGKRYNKNNIKYQRQIPRASGCMGRAALCRVVRDKDDDHTIFPVYFSSILVFFYSGPVEALQGNMQRYLHVV